MTRLARRLARMGGAFAPAREPLADALPDDQAIAVVSAAVAEGDAARRKLDALRTQMEKVLARSVRRGTPIVGVTARSGAVGAVPAQLREYDDSELPFVMRESAAGEFLHRIVSYGKSARVGQGGLEPAREALAELLSLLALDPSLHHANVQNALYLDTETTGLSGGTGTIPFLIGVARFSRESPNELQVEQYFLRALGHEEGILEDLRASIESASMLVTFNGKSFDMPLLRTRFVMHRMRLPKEPPHLDLLHVARRVHKNPFAEGKRGTRLVELEESLFGFERVGDIPGADIAASYMHYLRSGDTATMRRVVDHNVWDVLAMVALVGLYGQPLATSLLDGEALAGVARTLARQKHYDSALLHCEAALLRGGGASALDARARLQKARAERAAALADFEALTQKVDSPKVRLELAKLYEHHAKDPVRAIAAAAPGTGERDAAYLARLERLEKKRTKLEAARAQSAASDLFAQPTASRRTDPAAD